MPLIGKMDRYYDSKLADRGLSSLTPLEPLSGIKTDEEFKKYMREKGNEAEIKQL